MFLKMRIKKYMKNYLDKIHEIQERITNADAVVIGAGAGLSTSAGFTYSGKRFDTYFHDFKDKYGFSDMYTGGFYPYESQEEFWGYWSRYIYINRYMEPDNPLYSQLLQLVKDKEYFVLTTNVDHCFQKAGFDKKRIFYTQGDYGLFQCSDNCHNKTWDNEDTITKMVLSEGYQIQDGHLTAKEGVQPLMTVPKELIPHCPICGKPMTMNLRSDSTFAEDEGWHQASLRYTDFLQRHRGGKVVYLELGVGYNTPGIIKYPFWKMTHIYPDAFYC